MDIIHLEFEKFLLINIGDKKIKLITFKTQESGNIKFGIDAPRSVNVHREEIFNAIKKKEKL